MLPSVTNSLHATPSSWSRPLGDAKRDGQQTMARVPTGT